MSEGSLLGVSPVVDDALDRAAVLQNLELDSLKGGNEVREVGYEAVNTYFRRGDTSIVQNLPVPLPQPIA